MSTLCRIGYHSWRKEQLGPCYFQQVCRRCGKVQGPAKEQHDWQTMPLGSCSSQEVCKRCGKVDSQVQEQHDWHWIFTEKNSFVRRMICQRCDKVADAIDSSYLWPSLGDEARMRLYLELQDAVQQLAEAQKLWVITSYTPTFLRINKSQITAVQRLPATISTKTLRGSNIPIHSISTALKTICFYPEKVELNVRNHVQNRGFGWAFFFSKSTTTADVWMENIRFYPNVKIDLKTLDYLEQEAVPADSEILRTTWLYSRKDGGPDLRHSKNRQVPIVKYGWIGISLGNGSDLTLLVSKYGAALSLAQALENYISSDEQTRDAERGAGEDFRQTSRESQPTSNINEKRDAYEILGLGPGASLNEIVRAYRKLVQEYHPDKVAHLAPEFRDLAERRMKEINEAYEDTKNKFQ